MHGPKKPYHQWKSSFFTESKYCGSGFKIDSVVVVVFLVVVRVIRYLSKSTAFVRFKRRLAYLCTGSAISFGPAKKASFSEVSCCNQQNNLCWIVAWVKGKPLSSRNIFLKIMCKLWQNCHFIPGQKIWRTLHNTVSLFEYIYNFYRFFLANFQLAKFQGIFAVALILKGVSKGSLDVSSLGLNGSMALTLMMLQPIPPFSFPFLEN